jgi:hypothetical protein
MSCEHDWHGSDIQWNMWATDYITVEFEFACWKCGATASAEQIVKMSNLDLKIEQEE